MMRGKSYSEDHGCVDKELIMITYHTHPHLKKDNAMVYYYTEKATRTTSYAASINPYHNNNNGRNTFIKLVSQYAGEDKWQKLLKDSA